MILSEAGSKESVQYLLKARADVNTKNLYGDTALMLAALGNHIEIVRLLLKSGANINSKNHDDETVLKIAMSQRNSELVELLKMSDTKK